jgi:hypothetical protein
VRSLQLIVPALVCSVLLVTGAAQADPESDAKDLFTRGRELRAQGDCGGATDLFRLALRVYPAGLGSLRNLAECEEALGHWASARRAWIDLKRALVVDQDPKYAGWDEDADSGTARLAPKVATLTIDVATPLDPHARVEVSVDGERLATGLLGTALARDPGPHRIHAQGEDLEAPIDQGIELAAGDAKRVTLRLALRSSNRTAAPPPTSAGSSTAHVAGWVLAGAGIAAVAAAGVSLGVRQVALADLENKCPGYARAPCPEAVRSTVDRGQLASTLTTVFSILGGVAIAGGTGLLLVRPSKPSPTPAVTAGLGSLEARWVF